MISPNYENKYRQVKYCTTVKANFTAAGGYGFYKSSYGTNKSESFLLNQGEVIESIDINNLFYLPLDSVESFYNRVINYDPITGEIQDNTQSTALINISNLNLRDYANFPFINNVAVCFESAENVGNFAQNTVIKNISSNSPDDDPFFGFGYYYFARDNYSIQGTFTPDNSSKKFIPPFIGSDSLQKNVRFKYVSRLYPNGLTVPLTFPDFDPGVINNLCVNYEIIFNIVQTERRK